MSEISAVSEYAEVGYNSLHAAGTSIIESPRCLTMPGFLRLEASRPWIIKLHSDPAVEMIKMPKMSPSLPGAARPSNLRVSKSCRYEI